MVSKLINEDCRALLEKEGLLDIEEIFRREDTETVKALLEVRQTFRMQTADGALLYLKRYTNPPPDPFWDLIGARRFPSPASREFTVLVRLRELGIPAPVPAACLEEAGRKRVTRAALVTLGLPASTTLETLARDGSVSAHRRAALARRVGRLASAMHEGGVNHRDFYFVHLLVGDGDRVFVTDLNRADLRRHVGRRWRIKDLAALLQSAPPQVTLRDKVRFARAYFGSSLRPHRRFLDSVNAKAARMRAQTLKRISQGRPNYHVTG